MSEEQKSCTVEQMVAIQLIEVAFGLLRGSKECVGVSAHIARGSKVAEVAIFGREGDDPKVKEIMMIPRGLIVDGARSESDLKLDLRRIDEIRAGIDGKLSELVARYQGAIFDAHRRERA